MKCVQFPNGEIKRVPDFEADRLVKGSQAVYSSKDAYKTQLDGRITKAVRYIRENRGEVTAQIGVVKKSHMEGKVRVIEEVELNEVVIKPKLKAKDRRAKEKKGRK